MFFEGEAFSQSVKIFAFGELDSDLRVDFLAAFSLDVFLLNAGDVGQSFFAEDLSCFEDEGDTFSHSLDLQVSVLFEDELAEEQTLVES